MARRPPQCPACGKMIYGGAIRCRRCGAPLHRECAAKHAAIHYIAVAC